MQKDVVYYGGHLWWMFQSNLCKLLCFLRFSILKIVYHTGCIECCSPIVGIGARTVVSYSWDFHLLKMFLGSVGGLLIVSDFGYSYRIYQACELVHNGCIKCVSPIVAMGPIGATTVVLQGCLLGIHPPLVRSSVMSRKQLIFFEVQQFWLTTKLAQLKDNATWCNFSDQVLLFKNILVPPAGVSRSNHLINRNIPQSSIIWSSFAIEQYSCPPFWC